MSYPTRDIYTLPYSYMICLWIYCKVDVPFRPWFRNGIPNSSYRGFSHIMTITSCNRLHSIFTTLHLTSLSHYIITSYRYHLHCITSSDTFQSHKNLIDDSKHQPAMGLWCWVSKEESNFYLRIIYFNIFFYLCVLWKRKNKTYNLDLVYLVSG